MSEPGVRPGGLTALAVFNFVFALLQIMSGAGAAMSTVFMPMAVQEMEREVEAARAAESRAASQAASQAVESRVDGSEGPEAPASREGVSKAERDLEQMRKATKLIADNPGLMLLGAGVAVLLGILLVVSGIGYLKLRRFLGRRLGTVYALLEIAWGVAAGVYVNRALGEEFSLFSVIGFVFPAVTLLMLHVVFKDDFVNP